MKKFKNLKDICVVFSNTIDDNYVGIKFIDDEVKVYFPLGYEIPEENAECRKSIINLMKTISIGNRLINSDSKLSMNNGKEDEIPFNSFIWIINDYLNNGLYVDKEKIYKQNQNGKINWKKTLNTKFYISGKNAIYLNPYVEKNTLEDNIITDIHAYCVKISVEYIGWIFGSIPVPKNNIVENRLNYYITILNKELFYAFDDRKKTLLINLKKILEMSGGLNKAKLRNFGTNQYEYIWEHMVNSVFGNEDVSKFFPNSRYHLLKNKEPIEASSLRPDSIFTIDKDIYILDSKYYRYGITGNPLHLPNTDSVQKQIMYGKHVETKDNYQKIFNAFVLPYNKYNNSLNLSNTIEYVGYAESSWKRQSSNKYYEHVAVILLDTKYFIDCFTKNENANIDKMIASIQNVMSTFNEM